MKVLRYFVLFSYRRKWYEKRKEDWEIISFEKNELEKLSSRELSNKLEVVAIKFAPVFYKKHSTIQIKAINLIGEFEDSRTTKGTLKKYL
jgi:hypothetical protein